MINLLKSVQMKGNNEYKKVGLQNYNTANSEPEHFYRGIGTSHKQSQNWVKKP